MELPKRKNLRLQGYDYSINGAYFITICTNNRLNLFGNIIDGSVVINHAEKMVEDKLLTIANSNQIIVDTYCIMPNHAHAIILLLQDGTTQGSFPTISKLVQRFKTITTKLYIDGVKLGIYQPFDKKIWQKSFYDHIIRNENEYREIWQYIYNNPLKWAEDCYYER